MKILIGTKIGLGFSVALSALVLMGLVITFDLRELTADAGWVTHTVEVQQNLESLKASLPEAESCSRGFLLSPLPQFKILFRDAQTKTTTCLSELRILTHDNPIQQQRLDQLELRFAERLEQLQQLMALPAVPATSENESRNRLVQEGAQSTASINSLIADMQSEESNLLIKRRLNAESMSQLTSGTILFGTLAAFGIVAFVGFLVTRSITNPLRELGNGAAIIGDGNYAHRVKLVSRDEVGQLAALFNRMAEQVKERQDFLAEQDTLRENLGRFAPLFQGQRHFTLLCQGVLSELASILDARHSVFYIIDQQAGEPQLKLQASYASDRSRAFVKMGEGLAGECLRDRKRILLSDVPEGYLTINSTLGAGKPAHVVIQPVVFEEKIKAILELAVFKPLTPIQLVFLDQLSHNLGVVLNTIAAVMQTEDLLRQARISEQLLQQQQEELQQTNEEMEQTNEELQQTNEEMEEKVNLLAEQKRQMESANREIEHAREELENRAQQIAEGSRYKSEFLANMSHELRTPLNSLLILSKLLAENPNANLTPKEVQYAQTIYSSGNDLLELINEVLDLAKIESGSINFEPEIMQFAELENFLEMNFRHVAEGRKLGFSLDFSPTLPATMRTDPRRLQQVLKNLLSNAFKFTEQGAVALTVSTSANGTIKGGAPAITFSVKDSGMGIPADKHELVFGAFQQVDAGTARKFGGTGLGLSISRELATLLGGELNLIESSSSGSTFILILPANYERTDEAPPQPMKRSASLAKAMSPTVSEALENVPAGSNDLEDDRNNLKPGDMVLLIIDDDRNFSGLMRDFARDKKFKAITAQNAAQGVAMAHRFQPSAIMLDLHLPDGDGWSVLDKLKHSPSTRHIPTHIISVDEERERGMRLGAISFIQKPATKVSIDAALSQTINFLDRPLKNLLIIEDDSIQRQGLTDLIGDVDVHTTAVGSAREALQELGATHFDCIVLDLGLPDMKGVELIRTIHERLGEAVPPIIVYTGKELSRLEETELRLISDSIVIKNVRSPERLLDETALFLHRIQTKLPEPKQRMIELGQQADGLLLGRKVLIVDDDVRNIFAITSALESFKMNVVYAESGQGGIDLLEKDPGIEVVLMDIMMPEMDGFEAIKRIRCMDGFKKLPIISVTAKAMKDDREKCLLAGASDYITKPVNMDQLRSLLRVWLYR